MNKMCVLLFFSFCFSYFSNKILNVVTPENILYTRIHLLLFLYTILISSLFLLFCVLKILYFFFFNFIYITDYFLLNENVINTLQVFCYYILLDSSLCYSFKFIEMKHEKWWDNFANANAADWLLLRKFLRDYYLEF